MQSCQDGRENCKPKCKPTTRHAVASDHTNQGGEGQGLFAFLGRSDRKPNPDRRSLDCYRMILYKPKEAA
jgi:hypothetical protein